MTQAAGGARAAAATVRRGVDHLRARRALAVVRDALPGTKVILGGYYYTSDAADFLSMDADVFCIGAGEGRFERVVQGLRDGTSLDGIPGLYLREPDGGLRNTGRAEDPPLDTLALHIGRRDQQRADHISTIGGAMLQRTG